MQSIPQPFYPVEPPQDFDEPGKELGPDAQVWKTYVRETDQVDGELVDGWNKSTDVILIFAALFSAVSTTFVVESYKNLVPDPADTSAQTLLVISQTLKAMANASQSGDNGSPQDAQLDTPPFSASWSAICVNALWFLSLSLSVAVALISMLAKEWCLTFMSGRTGPPGAQARRRQQRWEGLLGWRMKEVLMILPSLIHLSLLFFAIGLCVFLWGIHIGVAIPVLFVTTVAASAYIACTVLPFLDNYCPYGTVISMLIKRFKDMHTKTVYDISDSTQDEVTAKALHWMVTNCETPRSVEVAVQSLAGAVKTLPRDLLVQLDMWTLIKRRLGPVNVNHQGTRSIPVNEAHMRALQSVALLRDPSDGLDYGSSVESQRLEVLVLGLQSCIDSLCYKIKEEGLGDLKVKEIIGKCANFGIQLLKTRRITPVRSSSEQDWLHREFWWGVANSEKLFEEITDCLERHLNGELDLGPTVHTILCTSLALLFCFPAAEGSPSLISKSVTKLLQAYVSRIIRLRDELLQLPFGSHAFTQAKRMWDKQVSRERELIFLLGMTPTLYDVYESSSKPEDESSLQNINARLEKAIESIWSFLITATYPDPDPFDRWTQCESGAVHLLANSLHYNMDPDSCMLLVAFVDVEILRPHSGRGRYLSNSTQVQFLEYVREQLGTA